MTLQVQFQFVTADGERGDLTTTASAWMDYLMNTPDRTVAEAARKFVQQKSKIKILTVPYWSVTE